MVGARSVPGLSEHELELGKGRTGSEIAIRRDIRTELPDRGAGDWNERCREAGKVGMRVDDARKQKPSQCSAIG